MTRYTDKDLRREATRAVREHARQAGYEAGRYGAYCAQPDYSHAERLAYDRGYQSGLLNPCRC